MTNLLVDLSFAFRTLRRSPLFAAVAILSLALGIGANTAIFTLIDQIILRKLPVKDPDSIVMLYQQGAHNGSNMGSRMNSYPIYQDYQTKAEPLAEVLCRRLVQVSLTADNQTERVDAEMVSGNYFSMLGVKPAVGRVFNSQEDDQVYQGHPVAVLSYDYWMSRFAGDSGVIGKKILVNNYPMTIVGVSAAGFIGLDPVQAPQIRVPILMKPQWPPNCPGFGLKIRGGGWWKYLRGSSPGTRSSWGLGPLKGFWRQNREYEMTLPAAAKWSAYDREQFVKGTLQVESAATGFSGVRNSFSTALFVLMAMVGVVLLIACANVANLLIARALARQKEVSVRLSIGATRSQLVRQLLVESLVLSIGGGAVGVLVAFAMTGGLLRLVPVEGNPLLIRPTPDLRILSFALGVSVLTALVFGLLPALRATRLDVWSTMKDAVGSIAGPRGSSLLLRKGLIAAQVALSFLLLFGAGLFVRSLQNLKATNTGFEGISNLVTFQLSPALNGYDVPRAVSFYRDLLESIRATPGVQAAAFTTVPVLSGDEWDSSTMVEGHQASDGEDMQAFMNSPSPGYFKTMGVPILEGRDFDARDVRPGARVAIVNQHFAKHFFGDKSAIGRHIGQNGPKAKLETEIIGVVADSLYEGPREGVHRQVFVPNYGNNSVAFYVRSTASSRTMYSAVREAVKKLDATLPIYQMKTLESQLDQTLLTERLIALLSAGFGLLATVLAVVGLYGVMAYVVARRTKELGIRLALGAQRASVIWIVLKEVFILLAIGLTIGVPSALGLGRLVSRQLYGIQAHDPQTALGMVLLLSLIATVAGMIPAHRASRIDPMAALRFE